MKKAFNYRIPGKEDHLIMLCMVWFIFLALLYIAAILYVVIDFMHRPSVMPRDVVVGFAGLKLHAKVWPRIRKQIFVKH